MHSPIPREEFIEKFSDYLKEHYYSDQAPEYFQTGEFENSINEQTHKRSDRFSEHLIPWIDRVFDLNGKDMLEIGSGTGASTQAFAPFCNSISCYEIDQKSVRAAKARAEMSGWANVSFEDEPFGKACRFAQQGRKADIVSFVGVLEHMPFEIVMDTLSTAFDALRPGGVIVITDTPNRLSPFDYHTSWIPFFQWLPVEVQRQYYRRSDRPHFVFDVSDVEKQAPWEVPGRLRGWGNGVSFHEFELALGTRVHDMIVADGWEDEIVKLSNVFDDDHWLLDMFEKMNVKAHKAFARSWLHLIIQKP